MENNNALPTGLDDTSYSSGLDTAMPGDLLAQSPILKKLMEQGSLPEGSDVPVPGESKGEENVPQPEDSDGNTEDEGNEEGTSEEGNTGEDPEGTQHTDLPSKEDIDWSSPLPVTIDGKDEYITLEELTKGYATAKHLSSEGRKLGEQRQELAQEREQKLAEIVQLGSQLHTQLLEAEQEAAMDFWEAKDKMEQAIKEGNTWESQELQAKRDQAQDAWTKAKTKRESLQENVGKHLVEQQERIQQQQIEYFNTNITSVMPDYTPEVMKPIYDFAVSEGIPAELLNQLYSPHAIKLLNDYRLLKEKSTQGSIKRKEAPVVKVPTAKRGVPLKAKQQQADENLRNRAYSENSTKEDHTAHIKNVLNLNDRFK